MLCAVAAGGRREGIAANKCSRAVRVKRGSSVNGEWMGGVGGEGRRRGVKEGGRGQPPVLQSTLQFESRVIFHHTILRRRLSAVQHVAKAELNAGIQLSAKTQRREPPNSGRELALDAMFWGVKVRALQLHWRLESTTLRRLRCGDFGLLFSLMSGCCCCCCSARRLLTPVSVCYAHGLHYTAY